MKLIVGCGYLGTRVAAAWQALGEQVAVVTRFADRAAALAAQGFQPIVADVSEPGSLATLAELPPPDTLLYAVGFDRASGKAMRDIYVQGLQNVLEAFPRGGGPRRWIYISTTGVYGSLDGQVTEETPCEPTREGGKICLEAEQLLRSHPLGQRCIVLRLAGIYGPGRIPNRQSLLQGEPIVADADSRLNLIHVDDAASVVLAAETRGKPPALYLVSDGQPPRRGEYYAEAARLLGAPPPQLISPGEATANAPTAGNPMSSRTARAHDASAKSIDNSKMLRELGVVLRYPSFREGLSQAIAAS